MGEIATTRYRVTSPSGNMADEYLVDLFDAEYAAEFRQQSQAAVERYLGPDFEVQVRSEPGSMTVVLTVLSAAAFGTWRFIKDYPDFVKGLQLLSAHVGALLDHLFAGGNGLWVEVEGIRPGPSIVAAESYVVVQSYVATVDVARVVSNSTKQLRNLLLYLAVVTSFILVCTILAILVLLLR